jgi:hypothetical protein
MAKTIYVLNGPNLNLLGTRQPHIYGTATLADVEKLCHTTAKQYGFTVIFRQSNYEGQIVDWINEARAEKAAGLIINRGLRTRDRRPCQPDRRQGLAGSPWRASPIIRRHRPSITTLSASWRNCSTKPA